MTIVSAGRMGKELRVFAKIGYVRKWQNRFFYCRAESQEGDGFNRADDATELDNLCAFKRLLATIYMVADIYYIFIFI